MKLSQTLFSEIENSIGGRPRKANTKVRMSFYLTEQEAHDLKMFSLRRDKSVSWIMRELVQKLIKE
ncbi:MAG: hypothetical protein U9O86_04965 [Campylobacterota bacterium]|nr:hypothetical protein [Campylobacterota bacterium]